MPRLLYKSFYKLVIYKLEEEGQNFYVGKPVRRIKLNSDKNNKAIRDIALVKIEKILMNYVTASCEVTIEVY